MLQDLSLRLSIPVRDMTRAKQFYGEKLGLTPSYEHEYAVIYRSGDSAFSLVESESAGQGQYSLMTWLVADIEETKHWLETRGVVFEVYNFPGVEFANGIADFGTDRVAWFKDSEGNLLAIAQLG
ncbi:MAG: VOC family protein [Chloroflexi bacterium]|nr:VOC family protein [Chloroflexota bacterium]